MTTARHALETALDSSVKALGNVIKTWPDHAAQTKLAEAVRSLASRRERLLKLPEMPMRLTEAQEVQHDLETIRQDGLASADAPFRLAVAAGVQPLVRVLELHARNGNGAIGFPEEHDLLHTERPTGGTVRAITQPLSLVDRAAQALRWLRKLAR